ncbi:MAG: response regulator [Bacteroidales bacterium]
MYTAENGKEGLELLQKHQPDLMVQALLMPVMDGLEMVEKNKKRDNNIRLVILSAYGEAEVFYGCH